MLKFCFPILLISWGILKITAGCDYFDYVNRNNEWVGTLIMDSGTNFGTEWILADMGDKVYCNYPGDLVGDYSSNIVSFTFAYKNKLPLLTKILANDTPVCFQKEPESFALKLIWYGTVPGTIYGTNSISSTASRYPLRLHEAPSPITKRTTAAPVVDKRIPAGATQEAMNEICGRRTSSFTPLIVGGRQVILGQIPWLVAIMGKKRGGVFYECGGSLISARTVISAAHCFQSRLTKDDVVIFIGKHQLDNYNERFETREPSNILIHTDFSETSPPDADLAIIQFEQPVGFTDTISPICLWTGPEDVHDIAGQHGFVAGWGRDGLKNVTNTPKMIDTAIVSDSVCRNEKHVVPKFVTSRVLCAGNLDDTGPCSGDSGSGLMIHINGRWQLRAITSGGAKLDGKCNLGSYVLYCDLAKHRTWLMSNILY